MSCTIPASKFVQQSVIKFLTKEEVSITENYTRMWAVYGLNNVHSQAINAVIIFGIRDFGTMENGNTAGTLLHATQIYNWWNTCRSSEHSHHGME